MSYEKETTSVPTYISLCSGYDGIGIGLKRAIPNLRTVAHVEIETYAIANLISKMEAGLLDACPVFTDLKQFPYEQLRDKVTILSAGFPCQPFSSAGKRKATEDPRHLYPFIADGVTAMRPRYVLLENVEGIISAKTGDGESVLKYVLGDLEQRGYRTTWGIFSASQVGAPHQRKRVFILAKLSEGAGLKSGFMGQRQEQLGRTGSRTSDTKLGNTSSERSCGGCEDSDRIKSEMLGAGFGKTRYPARPGEKQYEWEEPRVLGDTDNGRRTPCKHSGSSEKKVGGGKEDTKQADNGKTQSCMGVSTNRTAFRVDELRLLGNGVVPDTCELAFKTLIQQL
jgi:DNA (cytosine-5)-methyltransferase 1